jgi:site-specific DNA-methyltransferase (adenine-specific)
MTEAPEDRPYELKTLRLDDIDFGDRTREDYSNIAELAESIRRLGLISPICVCRHPSESAEKPYLLLAGGRRFTALMLNKTKSFPAKVYLGELSELDRKDIELRENIDREDLTWPEKVRLTQEIHKLRIAQRGVATQGSGKGHSIEDTGRELKRSRAAVQRDLELAEALEKFPQIGKAKKPSEARSMLDRIKRQTASQKAAESFSKTNQDLHKEKLVNSYIQGDFFERVQKIPEGMVSLVEIDPPYAIELEKTFKFQSGSAFKDQSMEGYKEISAEDYPDFLDRLFTECSRIMTTNGWLLCWHDVAWRDTVHSILANRGFEPTKLPAYWLKAHPGQTNDPSRALSSVVDHFTYARKGNAEIYNKGRRNAFLFNTVPKPKSHPTERPIELMQEIFRTFAGPGTNICVPFLGSGNSILAAANLNMHAYGFDLDPKGHYKNSFVMKVQSAETPNYRSYK